VARGRFISNKISDSERVNQLPITAQLLYTWMITHLDREGRIQGNPKIIKQKVIPLIDVTYKQVDSWLDEMAGLKKNGYGLIERYEVEGIRYIWMPGFDGEQSSRGGTAWKDRERESDIPPPAGIIPEINNIGNGVKEDILDPNFAAIVQCYHSEIGVISPTVKEKLEAIADEYKADWFQDAVKEAVENNARSIRYVEAILKRWKSDGKGKGKVSKGKQAPVKPEDEYEVDE